MTDIKEQQKILDLFYEGEIQIFDIDEKFLSDKIFFKNLCEFDAHNFQYASNKILKDKEFLLDIIMMEPYTYQYLTDDLLKDEKLFCMAVEGWPEAMLFADESLKSNKKLIISLLNEQPLIYKYLGEKLLNDKTIIKKVFNNIYVNSEEFEFLKFNSKTLSDKDIVKLLLKNDLNIFSNLSYDLRNDVEIWKLAISNKNNSNGMIIKNAGINIANNKDFVLEVIEKDFKNFRYLNEEMKKEEDVWVSILKNENTLLELAVAPQNILESKKVLLSIINGKSKSNNIFFHKFSDDLKKDKDIVEALLKNNRYTQLNFIPNEYYIDNQNTEKILKGLEKSKINTELLINILGDVIKSNDVLKNVYCKVVQEDIFRLEHLKKLNKLIYLDESFVDKLVNSYYKELMIIDLNNTNKPQAKKLKF